MNEITDRINDLELQNQTLRDENGFLKKRLKDMQMLWKGMTDKAVNYKISMFALKKRLGKFRLELKPDPKFGKDN